MNAISSFDVIVVGLGPAGASAARAAAQAGANVLAIERNAQPGLPVQCAEFVPLMIGMEMAEVFETQVQDVDHMCTAVEGADYDVTPDFRGHMIDRAKFDQLLIERASEAGADCRFGMPFRGMDMNGAVTFGDGEQAKAAVIIAGDGPRSPVGQCLGVANDELVETRQISVDLLQPHRATDIFLSADIKGGYGWLFPKGNKCNLGLGVVPDDKERLKPLLDDLHQSLVKSGRVGTEIHNHTGGLIPVGGITKLHKRHGSADILFTGDAAGLTNPVTGAGINAAVISGKLAGEAAGQIIAGLGHAGANASDDYIEEVEALFGASVARAVRRRKALMASFEGQNTPDAQALKNGWIAYPQYWANDGSSKRFAETDHRNTEQSQTRMSA